LDVIDRLHSFINGLKLSVAQAEQELSVKEDEIRQLKADVARYRRYWMTETRVVAMLRCRLPDEVEDTDCEVSEAHDCDNSSPYRTSWSIYILLPMTI
jgi:hypothetical protein